MKQTIKFTALLMMLFSMCFSFSACSDDDDKDAPVDPNSIYDYSIVWDVVDRGDYTTAEAQSLAAALTTTGEDAFEGYTESQAKALFESFCQEMRYELSTGYMKITLTAKLVRTEGNRTVATKTFYIDPDGTTIKLPAQPGNTSIVTVE